jgi:F-type H+-transporting ATPase subunit gamma
MARGLRDLRRKMKAIRSTRQVTKAMELVAASKMRRAVQHAQQLRRYAATAWEILQRIAEVHGGVHPFLTEKPVGKVLALLFTSDRGLAGSLHVQLFRVVGKYLQELQGLSSFEEIEFVAVGRKGQQFLSRRGEKICAAFPALSNHPTFRDALPIVQLATEGFLAGTYDHVVLLYNDFLSPLLQDPTVRILLPFRRTELQAMLQSLSQSRKQRNQAGSSKSKESSVREYLFEPSQESVLQGILPQLTEVQVYQAILEAAASEHSARMIAMRNATDNATDILDDLTLIYHQTRQAGITAELAELSASKAALE